MRSSGACPPQYLNSATVTADGLQFQGEPAVLDMSFCAFSGPVPGFLYPARGDARGAWRPLVFAMGNDFACPLPPGVTPDDNLTCMNLAPGAAPAAAPEQATAAPEQMTVAPAQEAAVAAAAPIGTHATTELQSVAAPLADRCGSHACAVHCTPCSVGHGALHCMPVWLRRRTEFSHIATPIQTYCLRMQLAWMRGLTKQQTGKECLSL